MSRIYLAARYSRRMELRGYARQLKALGHTITSRWLDGAHEMDDRGLSLEAPSQQRERFAREDWEDLVSADICVSFTETPRSSNSRGGRHVEFGAALALGIACVVIGPRENVFHCMPQVAIYEKWDEFYTDTKIAAEGERDGVIYVPSESVA